MQLRCAMLKEMRCYLPPPHSSMSTGMKTTNNILITSHAFVTKVILRAITPCSTVTSGGWSLCGIPIRLSRSRYPRFAVTKQLGARCRMDEVHHLALACRPHFLDTPVCHHHNYLIVLPSCRVWAMPSQEPWMGVLANIYAYLYHIMNLFNAV